MLDGQTSRNRFVCGQKKNKNRCMTENMIAPFRKSKDTTKSKFRIRCYGYRYDRDQGYEFYAFEYFLLVL